MKQLDNGYWRQSYNVENVYNHSAIFDSHDSIIDYIIHLWKNYKHFQDKLPLLNESNVSTTYVIYTDEDKDNENYLRHCKLNEYIKHTHFEI